jgi:hypothetical protein
MARTMCLRLRIGTAKGYLPGYHAAFSLTPQEWVQMGVNDTSVAPPPPTIVRHALRESAQRMREQAQQKAGVSGSAVALASYPCWGAPRPAGPGGPAGP